MCDTNPPSALNRHILCGAAAHAGLVCEGPEYFSSTGYAPCFSRPVYEGCYVDDSDRSFPSPLLTSAPLTSLIVSFEVCAKAAANAGSTLFAMQFPQGAGADGVVDPTTAQCFYGLSDLTQLGLPPYLKTPDTECQALGGSTVWSGGTYDHFGDAWRNAVYSISGERPILPYLRRGACTGFFS